MSAFVWTEALGCGEILPPALNSYVRHHTHPLHVIVFEEDLQYIPVNEFLIPVVIPSQRNENNLKQTLGLNAEEVRKAYQMGHNGTALLWEKVITTAKTPYLIHLDADTVFLGDVVSKITDKLELGYTIVGTRRPYRNSQAKKNALNNILLYMRRDAVNTHCFGFNKESISIESTKLRQAINGQGRNRLSQRVFPVIDFFDRVTFNLARKGKIFYLDSSSQGKYGIHTREGDLESKMISFAAVGSGCSFYKNPLAQSSPTYKEFALASYSLYSSWLLETNIEIDPLDSPFLTEKLSKLNKTNWTLG